MLFKKQKSDWILVALFALGLFLYGSYQPRFRLNAVMPADFVDTPLAGPSQKPGPEAKIAGAYWSCLANNIQWQYGYGHTLPSDPPADFTSLQASLQASGAAAEDAATRARYWRRAQRIWYLPTAWQKQYEWNFNWTSEWVQSGGEAVHHLFERLGS
jgi:hypothetical protein